MTRKLTAWDILDKMWEEFPKVDPKTTWKEFVNHCSPSDTEEFVKVAAFEKFVFETKHVAQKPDRSTMEWLWGDHALLYDVWGCKKHRFVCRTSDNCADIIDGLTIFCPECNKHIMPKRTYDKYMDVVGGEFITVSEWKSYVKTSRWHKNYIRKENFKFMLSHLKDRGYMGYKMSMAIRKVQSFFGIIKP